MSRKPPGKPTVLDRCVRALCLPLLQRLEQSGAFITTSESAIFMLTQSADHAKFKAISGLVKEHAKNENPFNAIAGL
jgi:hypothetical protein